MPARSSPLFVRRTPAIACAGTGDSLMTSRTDAPVSASAPAAPAADQTADTSAEKRARPARKARPVKRRAEGQWKLGYREPLNPNEQVKKDDNPLNVRARIENIYSKQG